MTKRLVAFVLALGLTGCPGTFKLTRPEGASYSASVCASAAGQNACLTLAKPVTVQGDGQQLAELVVALAGPYLTRVFNYQSCLFTTYPESAKGGQIVVTGSAVCKLNGVPVPAKVVVTLAPVVEPPVEE